MAQANRRRGDRVVFKVSTIVLIDGKQIKAESTENLSTGGVFIRSSETPELNQPCKVHLEVSGRTSLLQMEIEGRVARVEPEGFAVEFTRVDLDSYTYLRYVVEYNRPVAEQGEGHDLALPE